MLGRQILVLTVQQPVRDRSEIPARLFSRQGDYQRAAIMTRAFSVTDRHNLSGVIDELVPGNAAMFDDIVVIFQDAVR